MYVSHSFLVTCSYFGEYKVLFNDVSREMFDTKWNVIDKRVIWITGKNNSLDHPTRFNGIVMAEFVCNNCNEDVMEKKSSLVAWAKDCVPDGSMAIKFLPHMQLCTRA